MALFLSTWSKLLEANYYWKTFSPTKSFKEELLLSKYLKKLAKVLKKYEKPKNDIIFPIFSKALEAKDKKEILNEFKLKDRVFMKKVFQCFWLIFSFYFQEAKPRLKKFIKLFKNPEIKN